MKGDSNFGGIMMWSAGFSDSNVNNGCNYAQEAKTILLTGSPCSSGPVSVSIPPVTTPTSTSSSPGSSQTPPSGSGTVPQWGQVSYTPKYVKLSFLIWNSAAVMATQGQLSVYHRTSAWPPVNGGHSVSRSFVIHHLRITNGRLGKEMAKKTCIVYKVFDASLRLFKYIF